MAFTLTVRCEGISEVTFENYEGKVVLEKVIDIDLDSYNVDSLIEMVGRDRILDTIGRDEVIKYFDIEEKDE